MSSDKLPKVTVSVDLVADFGNDEPGFELSAKATYRELPKVGLIMIEKELGGLIERLAEGGAEIERQKHLTEPHGNKQKPKH